MLSGCATFAVAASANCADPHPHDKRTAHARTAVRFRPLDATAIEEYVERGEWQGRAGGYAIQEAGAALVSNIDGCFFNVVGLPVALLVEMLGERRRPVST